MVEWPLLAAESAQRTALAAPRGREWQSSLEPV